MASLQPGAGRAGIRETEYKAPVWGIVYVSRLDFNSYVVVRAGDYLDRAKGSVTYRAA